MAEVQIVDEVEAICCKGRTGVNRAKPVAKVTYLSNGTIHVRVDDLANPGFWLEFDILKQE